MKQMITKIERCGDCKHIKFVDGGTWRCELLNDRVSLQTIPLLCPLEDDEPTADRSEPRFSALLHHMDSTVGLWATDRPDLLTDEEKRKYHLFQIKATKDYSPKTCAKCKHWGDSGAIRECNSDKIEYGMNEKYLKDGLQYIDYEEYQAFLKTGPNFGCIHHEVKPCK